MKPYSHARRELLGFFLRRMYGGNIPHFRKINNFPNEVERMKYFITRFNVYSPDEIFEYINLYPEDAKYFGEEFRYNVYDKEIHSIKKINQGIEKYLRI